GPHRRVVEAGPDRERLRALGVLRQPRRRELLTRLELPRDQDLLTIDRDVRGLDGVVERVLTQLAREARLVAQGEDPALAAHVLHHRLGDLDAGRDDQVEDYTVAAAAGD